MKTLCCIFVIRCFLNFDAAAASPRTPGMSIVSSEYPSECFFVMGIPSLSQGRCYKYSRGTQFKTFWTIKGFFAFPEELLLSIDGSILVRRVRLDINRGVTNATPCIRIYRYGKLVHTISVGQIIDSTKLGASANGNEMLIVADPPTEPQSFSFKYRFEGNGFTPLIRLRTIDGRLLFINAVSGKVLRDFDE